MKRAFAIFGGVVLIAALWFFALRPADLPERRNAAPVSRPNPAGNAAPSGTGLEKSRAADSPPEEFLNLAADLNAPGHPVQRDLQILDGVFSVWRTNFLHEGNPVGENIEITAALTGHNSLHVAFLAPDHRAINSRGELCDRWGTPFFFHQLSGTKMEIVSAGPDRKRGTADDVVFTP